jgi:hypothetical protein
MAVEPSRLYSLRLVDWHFWLATIGIVLYIAAMWVSGIMQGLMWREYDDQGFLVNYSFIETVNAMHPLRHAHHRWRPVPHRWPDHGLQPLPHDRGDGAECTSASAPAATPAE